MTGNIRICPSGKLAKKTLQPADPGRAPAFYDGPIEVQAA
jgi:hypothetical protein